MINSIEQIISTTLYSTLDELAIEATPNNIHKLGIVLFNIDPSERECSSDTIRRIESAFNITMSAEECGFVYEIITDYLQSEFTINWEPGTIPPSPHNHKESP